MEKIIITSIYVKLITKEKYSETETKILKSFMLHLVAWARGGDVFLNPPQTLSEEDGLLFEVDLVFPKAIDIKDGEHIKLIIEKRIQSAFRNAKLEFPSIVIKEKIVKV